uniref:U-box domain-containing protein n=2 Tax=Davidia involucrata TaxID=16924 RepID=A0A5B6YTG5_DAVIN
MDEIEVPTYFLCPISLEIMKDPVTLSTGITYDRESIEKWIFSGKNNTCPVTKQVLSDSPDLTPNHTLRRLIQSWCTLNATYGIERIPTPKPPINKAQIVKLINDAKSPQLQMKCLRRLRSIASASEANKRCIEAAGAIEFLASIINNTTDTNTLSDEALSILYYLQLSDTSVKSLVHRNGEFIESLTRVLRHGHYESRAYAVLLLKSILEVVDPMQIMSLSFEFFTELVQVLRDQISYKASKSTLQLLINVCPWGRNKVKAVDAGAVTVLIDLLLDFNSEKRVCEMVLMVLDQLCQCADGRAELLKHGAGLAIVSKKILRVSKVASERAVKILHSISKFCAGTASVLQEMLQLGVVAKLCLVLQVDCGIKTKERVTEILKLHARVWKNSPCIPMNLLSSYPS